MPTLAGLSGDLDFILFSVLPLSSSTHYPTQTTFTLVSEKYLLFIKPSFSSILHQAQALVFSGLLISKTYSKK